MNIQKSKPVFFHIHQFRTVLMFIYVMAYLYPFSVKKTCLAELLSCLHIRMSLFALFPFYVSKCSLRYSFPFNQPKYNHYFILSKNFDLLRCRIQHSVSPTELCGISIGELHSLLICWLTMKLRGVYVKAALDSFSTRADLTLP